jgi:tRNA U34 5-methylaminomethyl-2-thiouridine-forming methyltransferase MnmC
VAGDARQTVPEWQGRADAWFLDGFAPPRNPELWEEDLLRAVAAHTAPGGHLRHLFRRRIGAPRAGRRRVRGGASPGFGRKRHMTVGG